MEKEISKCYKLPWTEEDNPNGWIEPTTFCNISCPGCYRGIDKPDHKGEHLDLDELKKQVDWFKKNRNTHTISLAGGEPLMYPHIIELIEYIVKAGLRVMLYTNGFLLTKEYAERLMHAGLTQIVVHVDRFQKRADLSPQKTQMQLKEEYVEIFRDLKDIRLGFIQPISASCNEELNRMMDFITKNIDVVNLMVFTLYRNICWKEDTASQIDTNISIKRIIEQIRENNEFVPAAFLGSTKDNNNPTWLFAQRSGMPNNIFGYFSPKFYAFAHKRYRKKKGKYLFISRANTIKTTHLKRLFYYSSIRNILKNYSSYRKQNSNIIDDKMFFQTILLLRGPEQNKKEWDLCDGCPDRIIYKGKLLPSCILEDLKNEDNDTYKKCKL